MSQRLIEIIVTITCSIMASSGFWAMLQHLMNRNDSSRQLLLGLAHDRIMSLGSKYIDRGYITTDEYENLERYLYEPYVKNGGNGSTAHVMERVKTLEVRVSKET